MWWCLPEYVLIWFTIIVYLTIIIFWSRVISVWNVDSLKKKKIRIQYLKVTLSLNLKTFIVLDWIVLTTSAIRLRLIELRFIIHGGGKNVNFPGSRETQVDCFLCCHEIRYYSVTESVQLLVFLFFKEQLLIRRVSKCFWSFKSSMQLL